MDDKTLEIEDLLKELRTIIGEQAQQIAMLKAIISRANAGNSEISAGQKDPNAK